jgi:hypothetical protein
MIELPERILGSLIVLVTDELERAKHEVNRQKGMRQNGFDQIKELIDENTQLIRERDEARRSSEEYRIELMCAVELLDCGGIDEIRDAIRDLQSERSANP